MALPNQLHLARKSTIDSALFKKKLEKNTRYFLLNKTMLSIFIFSMISSNLSEKNWSSSFLEVLPSFTGINL